MEEPNNPCEGADRGGERQERGLIHSDDDAPKGKQECKDKRRRFVPGCARHLKGKGLDVDP